MKNKTLFIFLYVVLGLAVPFSLISWLGTIITVANIEMFSSVIVQLLMVITMLLAGTYFITYCFCLSKTIKKKSLSIISFAPIFHIFITVLFYLLCAFVERLEI